MESGCHARVRAAVTIAVWVAATVGAVGAARAQRRVARPAPARAYVVVFGTPGVEESARRSAEDAVAAGVRGGGSGVDVVLSERPVDADAEGALGEADAALAAGRTKVQEFDLDGAIEALSKAATIYSRWLPDLVRRDGASRKLLDAYRLMAVAHFLNADEEAASRALSYCFALVPTLEYNDADFPPQMRELVMTGRLLVEELGQGIVDVRVPGHDKAVIYIGGLEQGGAPIEIQDLPAGPTIVNLVLNGVTVGVDVAQVDGGDPVILVMQVPEVAAAIPPSVEAVRGQLGRSKAGRDMRAVAKELGVEALVFVIATGDGFEGYVYDARTGRLAGKATGKDAREVGGALMSGADWGTVRAEVAGEPPIWNPDHKYFWHAVGAAAGVVTVVTVGVIAVKSRGLSPGERHVVFGLGTTF